MSPTSNFCNFFKKLFSTKEEDKVLVIKFAYRYALNGKIFSGYIVVRPIFSKEAIVKRKKFLKHQLIEDWIKAKLDYGVRQNKTKIAFYLRQAKYRNIALMLKDFLGQELIKVDVQLVQIVINE